MDFRLELVLLPVADVDRAKAFYERVGFHCDVDHRAGDDFRVVQFTPPGSSCSVSFGVGVTDGMQPGSVRGLHLVVTDLAAAVAELRGRGVEVSNVRHMGSSGWQPGVDPAHRTYASFADFTDPDGNAWVLQEAGHPEAQP